MDVDETERGENKQGSGEEGKEVSDEDLKCFHYWLSDASMR